MERPKRVTMLDVARESGVSYQTVSRVINNHPKVADETRARVLTVIEHLNYRPSKFARSLAAHQSHTLAVITFSLGYYGPTQMVVNIERAACEAGYDIFFSNIDPINNDDVWTCIDRIAQWSVDGVLLIAPVASNQYEQMVHELRHTPLIQIDITPGASAPSVIIDQQYGSYVVTRHLVELGHTQICEISGPLTWYGAVARQKGFQKALLENDLKPVATVEGNWTAESGGKGALSLLAKHDFTAIVVGNDQMALGAISVLAQCGLKVPQDVSVVGFDNIPEAAYFTPPLTTIHQDFSALGRKGLEYLVELIENPDAQRGQRVIKPKLIVRQSSAAPAGDR